MKKHISLIYTGRLRRVQRVVHAANEILSNPEFYHKIRGYKDLHSGALSPNELADQMQAGGYILILHINFVMFRAKPIVFGPKQITLCYWKLSRNLPSAINLLISETVNYIDFKNKPPGVFVQNKSNDIVAWVIGAIGELMVNDAAYTEC